MANTKILIEKHRSSAEEAIIRYDPLARDLNIYAVVPEFGGGVMMLAEGNHASGGGKNEYFVHLKDGQEWVYTDYAMAMRAGSKQADVLTKVVSPEFVTAVLTIILVLGYLWYAFHRPAGTNEAAEKVLTAALTTVIGFWFGRQVR
jgi:hypothetical protein